jgi:hypothetical protein
MTLSSLIRVFIGKTFSIVLFKDLLLFSSEALTDLSFDKALGE